jgi:uncharacterized protein (DUF305 family)
MNKMMMNIAVRASGDVDADFTAMMIPHHQGAVDTAEAALPRARRIRRGRR